jgi:hypothetical protein
MGKYTINIKYRAIEKNKAIVWGLVTVTYAHHSLIQGNRSGALNGLVATVLLALVFTGLDISCMSFFSVGFTVKGWPLSNNYSSATVDEPKLSPYWVTGFADAESSFSLKVSKSSSTRSGWNVIPEFQITLHSRDLLLLRKIHSFFGIGIVGEREDRNQAYYSVQSARAIVNVIIPHFDRYPLITQKRADYLLFKQAVNLLIQGQARSSFEGIREILSLKGSMNKGLSDTLKLHFPDILLFPRPVVGEQGIQDPSWLTGFVDGEGFFYVKSLKNKRYSSGFNVTMVFSISQHVRDEALLTKFIDYLGCGRIERASTRPDIVNFSVSKFSNIKEKVIPFFQSCSLHGIKHMDYLDFVKVAKIVEVKGHLTPEGINKINSLKSGMNSSRLCLAKARIYN